MDADQIQVPAPVADAAQPQHPVNRAVKLSPFWPANPAAWFRAAEGSFVLRGIDDELARFYNVLHALPEATVTLVADLVEAEPLPANPYTELRRRLLAAHQLTDLQRVNKIIELSPLAAQKPSELLAEMLRLCPRGQENNVFFNSLFLSKLPREIRVLLTEADLDNKQELGARADAFAAHHTRMAHDATAAVAAVSLAEPEEPLVAAVKTKQGSGGRGGNQKRGGGSSRGGKKRGGAGGASGQVSHTLTHSEQARMGSGICKSHWTYGPDALYCDAPCSWSGN